MDCLPIENNPLVLSKYLKRLGVENNVEFTEVYGFSDELLQMLPHPVMAFLFVFPVNRATEKLSYDRAEECAEESKAFMKKNNIVFIRQITPNSCGSVALAHILLNKKEINVRPDSILYSLLHSQAMKEYNDSTGNSDSTSSKTDFSTVIGRELSLSIAEEHQEAAQEGGSSVNESTNLHFASYIAAGGRCIELDGRQENIILHDKAENEEEFICAASKAMREKISVCPDSIEFCCTALVNLS